MSLKSHVVVFAKAPRLGAVKTRLARDIGAMEALRFYRNNLNALVRRLSRDRRWQTWLAVTPDGSAQSEGLWPKDVPRLAQGPGDLGERMQRVMNHMPPGPVVLVGSDIPGIQPQHVARAFGELGKRNSVLGPTPDGGYWLVGMKRHPTVPQLFDYVRWSSGFELQDTVGNAKGAVGFVETLTDVDTGADLIGLRQSKT
jgi:uncharacterized protein